MLKFNQLTLSRGNKLICKNLTLDLEKGSSVFIHGKNGSGKSTFVESIIGNHKPVSGEILIDHRNVYLLSSSEKKIFLQSTGIALQENLIRPYDSVKKSLWHKKSTPEEISEMLTFLGFEDRYHQLSKFLSCAERRQLDLARALIGNPRLLLLDEPFCHFDKETKEKFKNILAAKKSQGVTIVVASVDQDQYSFLNFEKKIML